MTTKINDTVADSLVDSYADWREACRGVRAAYESWEASRASERESAFGGYLAALQREHHAARIYQNRLELLRQAAVGTPMWRSSQPSS